MTTSTSAAARTRDIRSGLARAGLTAKGVLYIVLGALAVQLGLGTGSGNQASQSGAIETLATQPFGQVLVGAMALGLLAHGAWQLVATLTGDPVEGDNTLHRAKYAARTVVYLGLGGLAVSVLFRHGGSGSGSGGDEGSDQAAAALLGLPGGTWIAIAIGLIGMGVGAYEIVHHGRRAAFMGRIGHTVTGRTRRNVERAGRAGYVALGIVALITGGFFVVAALRHDPEESKGMSEALQTLSDQPWGTGLLLGVAVGVVLYGLFCLAEARYRRSA